MIYLFFATGTEEIEALATVDIIRRAGLPLTIVSINDDYEVIGAHGISVVADALLKETDFSDADLLVLPGGLPGATNFDSCPELCTTVVMHAEEGKPVAAICAAPLVLGHLGLLEGRRATCYPGFEGELSGATCTGALVEVDGQFITGKGPAAAFEFAYTIVELLQDKETADALRAGMLWTEI